MQNKFFGTDRYYENDTTIFKEHDGYFNLKVKDCHIIPLQNLIEASEVWLQSYPDFVGGEPGCYGASIDFSKSKKHYRNNMFWADVITDLLRVSYERDKYLDAYVQLMRILDPDYDIAEG